MRYAAKENECSKRQLGQLACHERERSQHCDPVQPRFFPSLPPSRRRRSCLERESNKRSRLQPMTLSTKISHPIIDSIVTTNVLESSSTTLLPNLNEDTTTIVSPGVRYRQYSDNNCSPRSPGASYMTNMFQQMRNPNEGTSAYTVEGVTMDVAFNTRNHEIPDRHSLGLMNRACPHCSALHWLAEKLTKSSVSDPLFGKCCLQGKIRLPPLIAPPLMLKALYDGHDEQSKSFRQHTREYNAANAFTSLGATFDDRVIAGRGPRTFTIKSRVYCAN